jgi:hypothetical protein
MQYFLVFMLIGLCGYVSKTNIEANFNDGKIIVILPAYDTDNALGKNRK